MSIKDLFATNKTKSFLTYEARRASSDVDGEISAIDLYGQAGLYGRIDYAFNAVYPSEAFLKEIEEDTFVLNFVADAYEDLKNHFNKLRSLNKLASKNTKLKTIKATAGWRSLPDAHHKYVRVVFDTFFQTYGKNLSNVSVEEFINTFYQFLRDSKNSLVFTRTSFIESPMYDPLMSGLMIELQEEEKGDDTIKRKYYEDPNFDVYQRVLRIYGFKNDKNHPWRIISDIESAPMLQYMEKYGIDNKSMFDEFFYRSYELDIDIMQEYLREYYNLHQSQVAKRKSVVSSNERTILPIPNFDDGAIQINDLSKYSDLLEQKEVKVKPIQIINLQKTLEEREQEKARTNNGQTSKTVTPPYVAPEPEQLPLNYWTTLWVSEDTQGWQQSYEYAAQDAILNMIASPEGGVVATPTADATDGIFAIGTNLDAGLTWQLDQGANVYWRNAVCACGSNFVGISDEGTPRLFKADFATGTEAWGVAINGGAVSNAMVACTTDGNHIFVSHSGDALEYYDSSGTFQATVATAGGNIVALAVSGDQTTIIVAYDTEVIRGYTISGFNGSSTPVWSRTMSSGNTHNENAIGTDARLISDEDATAGGGVWFTAGSTSEYIWHLDSSGTITVSWGVQADVTGDTTYSVTQDIAIDTSTGYLWAVGGSVTTAGSGINLRNRIFCYQPDGTFVGSWCGAHQPTSLAINGGFAYVGNTVGWVTKISIAELLAAPANALQPDYSSFRTISVRGPSGDLYVSGESRMNRLDRFDPETGLVVATTGRFYDAYAGGWTIYSLVWDESGTQVLLSNVTVTASGGGDKSFSEDLTTVNWTGPNAAGNGPRGLALTPEARVFTAADSQNRWQKYRSVDGIEVMNSSTGYEDIAIAEVGYNDIANYSKRGLVSVGITGDIAVWTVIDGLHAITAADEADQMTSVWTFTEVYGDASDNRIDGSAQKHIAVHTSGRILDVRSGRIYLINETDGSLIAEWDLPINGVNHRGYGGTWYIGSFDVDQTTGDIFCLCNNITSDSSVCDIIRITCDGESLTTHTIWSEQDPGETSEIWRTSLGDGVTRFSGAPTNNSTIAITNGIIVIMSSYAGTNPFNSRFAAYRLTATLEGG